MSVKAPSGIPAQRPVELPKVRSGVGAPVSFKPQALPVEGSEGKPKVIAGQFKLAPASDIFFGDDATKELKFVFDVLGGAHGYEPGLPKFDAVTSMAVIAALGDSSDQRLEALQRGIKNVNSQAVVRKLGRDETKNAARGGHDEPIYAEIITGGRALRVQITESGFDRYVEKSPEGAAKKKP